MAEIDSKAVQEAFETIRKAFQEKTGDEILSISSINFIIKDASETRDEKDDRNKFVLDARPQQERPLAAKVCRRVGHRWVCSLI